MLEQEASEGDEPSRMRDSDDISPYHPLDRDIPTLEELIAETGNASAEEEEIRWEDEIEFENQFQVQAVDAERAWAHLKGLQDHYRHKKNWSIFLMAVLAGMIIFQWLLLAMVGLGKWDFTKYEWLLPILLVQNLGQIIGLAFVVVKSLFKDMDSKN